MPSFSTALRNARGEAIITEAGSSAILRIYTTSYAALLSEHTCSSVFGVMSGGVLTLNEITDETSAVNSGTPVIAKLFKSDGTTEVITGLTVGTTGTNIIVDISTINAGDIVTGPTGTITEGNA